jgi:hypothetical protein
MVSSGSADIETANGAVEKTAASQNCPMMSDGKVEGPMSGAMRGRIGKDKVFPLFHE